MWKKIGLTLVILMILSGALAWRMVFRSYGQSPVGPTGSAPISHQTWTELLQVYVGSDGWVDYQGFQRDSLRLKAYLNLISENPPAADWPEKAKLAYWINAYNAFTIKLIIDHYPLNSIRDLHTVPLVATIWHEPFFRIGGQATSLDQIEHGILRKEFAEPRIHFAINCASVSCPVLRNEAFTAEKLEKQLTEQAKRFLREPIRNRITADKAEISALFLWFRGDFTKDGQLSDFLSQYAPVKINSETDVSYLPYDWSLNDIRSAEADLYKGLGE